MRSEGVGNFRRSSHRTRRVPGRNPETGGRPWLTLCIAAVVAVATGAAADRASAQEPAAAVETRVLVRVVSHDAKIIGSGVGGARVTVRELSTGRVLAQGVQEGSTGSTQKIMTEPRVRGSAVYGTEGAAGFLARLSLDEPTRVEISARGPLGTPHAEQRATTTMLLLPGHHVTGEGVVLELHGFTVEILEPPAPAAAEAGGKLPVTVRITMLCGCPTRPEGMWDSRRIRRVARLVGEKGVVSEAGLQYAGETSTYWTSLELPEPGAYTLEVTAADPERANFGIARRPVVVRR